jgi:uncharacterized protein
MPIITPDLIRAIRSEYALSWRGVHGVAHWARVLENGLRLASSTGANLEVVQLFAVFHDARRFSDYFDPDHGRRGADFAETLRGRLFELPDDDFARLYVACSDHADGLTEGEITVQTCWDADRLDLGRVGTWPDTDLLCTDAAKHGEMIAWADERSTRGHVPEFVDREWDVV